VAERAERAVIYFVRRPTPGSADETARPDAPGTTEPSGPPAGLFLTEPIRGLFDLAALLVAAPWLATAPRGDGHGVLVLPGLLASDSSTLPLRVYLGWLGYDVRGWDLGRNRGPTEEVLAGLPRALLTQSRRTGRPVSLVGWSLGGVYARELARRNAKHVRQVITLGSPFALTDLRRQSRVNGPYQRLSHLHADEDRLPTSEQRARPIGVPSTSVYSRLDGVVSWQACREAGTRTSRSAAVTSASASTRPRCG
jgi:pimeloyl-ACP methyl ester carboxylesterase